MNIAVTGYYGTGSSAVIDFLSELEKVKFALGIRYEHTNLNCRDGIFDLETLLYSDNTNYYSRDMAINRFRNEMFKQYDNDFGWYGSYKKLFGKDVYMNLVDELVNNISIAGDKGSLAHTTKTRFSLVKAVLQIGAKILIKHPISKLGRKYVYDGDPQRYLTATHDEFLVEARKFINGYFSLCKDGDNNMVYDHLLFPEQCGVVDRFFDDDFRLIVVDRDPRDIYFLNLFVWNTAKCGYQSMAMPTEVHAFCKYWRAMHEKTFKNMDSNKIMYVHFEDLIYKYEDTTKKIKEFCGIPDNKSITPKKYFDPSKSINNTQTFRDARGHEEDLRIIESELSEYLYEFPYTFDNNLKECFD